MPLIGPGRRMVRRRAVVGAAVVGGAAYHAGKQNAEPAPDAAPEEPPPQEAPAEPEYMDEIQQLAELRDQGVLTDEEFEAKKKDILGL